MLCRNCARLWPLRNALVETLFNGSLLRSFRVFVHNTPEWKINSFVCIIYKVTQSRFGSSLRCSSISPLGHISTFSQQRPEKGLIAILELDNVGVKKKGRALFRELLLDPFWFSNDIFFYNSPFVFSSRVLTLKGAFLFLINIFSMFLINVFSMIDHITLIFLRTTCEAYWAAIFHSTIVIWLFAN